MFRRRRGSITSILMPIDIHGTQEQYFSGTMSLLQGQSRIPPCQWLVALGMELPRQPRWADYVYWNVVFPKAQPDRILAYSACVPRILCFLLLASSFYFLSWFWTAPQSDATQRKRKLAVSQCQKKLSACRAVSFGTQIPNKMITTTVRQNMRTTGPTARNTCKTFDIPCHTLRRIRYSTIPFMICSINTPTAIPAVKRLNLLRLL